MAKVLTQAAIDNAKPKVNADGEPVRTEIPDARQPGLYLIVQPSSQKASPSKSWAVRYRFAGIPRKYTLGPYPGVALADARKIAGKALTRVAEGHDPSRDKLAAKDEQKRAAEEEKRGKRDLFENVAREFIARHAMKNTRETSWRETARILGLKPDPANPAELIEFEGGGVKVIPLWRGRKVQDTTKRDVIALLDRIADGGSPIMANRVLAAIRKLFNWCVSRDVIAISPCVGVEPPSPENSRDRILSDDELRLLWNATDKDTSPHGPLVKLLLLTGQRLGEVAGMRWDEIDFDAKVWVLPAERVKNNTKHEVPLSPAALAVIASVRRVHGSKGLVFTTNGDVPVSGFSRAKDWLDATMAEALADGAKKVEHWTFHDLRRTLASGMAKIGIQLPVVEKILNHTSGSFRGVVGVYQRHDYADEKRKALEAWASYVQAVVDNKPASNVVRLRAEAERV